MFLNMYRVFCCWMAHFYVQLIRVGSSKMVKFPIMFSFSIFAFLFFPSFLSSSPFYLIILSVIYSFSIYSIFSTLTSILNLRCLLSFISLFFLFPSHFPLTNFFLSPTYLTVFLHFWIELSLILSYLLSLFLSIHLSPSSSLEAPFRTSSQKEEV